MHDIWLYRPRKNSPVISAPPKTFTISKKTKPINLRYLKDAFSVLHPEFTGFEQHDSQEFLTHLITAMHTEMNPADSLLFPRTSSTSLR